MFTKRVEYVKLPTVLAVFIYPKQVGAGLSPSLQMFLFLGKFNLPCVALV